MAAGAVKVTSVVPPLGQVVVRRLILRELHRGQRRRRRDGLHRGQRTAGCNRPRQAAAAEQQYEKREEQEGGTPPPTPSPTRGGAARWPCTRMGVFCNAATNR